MQTGDTLNSLATRTHVSVFDLQQANCLESFTIQPGQQIYLPTVPPPPTNTPAPGPTPTSTRRLQSTPTPITPQIDRVVPDRVDQQTAENEVVITVFGKFFRSRETGFRVELRGPQNVELQLGEARTDTSFDAIVPANLPVGAYDMVVTNPNDRAGFRRPAFTIGEAPTPTPTIPAPRIFSVSPSAGNISQDNTLTITGDNFSPKESGFKVELQLAEDGEPAVTLEVDEDTATNTSFKAIIKANQLEQTGTYDLLVTNPDNQTAIKRDAYEATQ